MTDMFLEYYAWPMYIILTLSHQKLAQLLKIHFLTMLNSFIMFIKIHISSEAHKAMCQNSTAENKRIHKSMRNKANSKAITQKAEEAILNYKIAYIGCLG